MFKFETLYRPLISTVERIDNDIAKRISGGLPYSLSQDELSKLTAGYAKIETELNSVNSAYNTSLLAQQRHRNITERAEQLDKTIKSNIEDLKSAQDNARLSLPDNDQRSQIENVIFEFNAMRLFVAGLVYRFALAPSDTLVLVLVVVMGLLGSSLHLSYIYVNEYAARPISFYLFRPFLGTIMALAMYIVAKAGIPLFTDVSRTSGTASVNPYFISFLGIISGLLSERALEGLRQVGSSYFRENQAEPNRWARESLREEFQATNRDPEKLATILNTRKLQLEAWLAGTEPVPANVQILLAAILDKPRRDLFTDFPPVSNEAAA
jgi:hypothetical protein